MIKDQSNNKNRRLRPEEGVCKICKSGAIEDEYHFLFECPSYYENRKLLFDSCCNNAEISENIFDLDTDRKTKWNIVMNENWKMCMNFIVNTWEVRKGILYK